MLTTLKIDKTKCTAPATVDGVIKELQRWRRNRIRKNLECGTLDRSIKLLERYQRLLGQIHVAELNTPAPEEIQHFDGCRQPGAQRRGDDGIFVLDIGDGEEVEQCTSCGAHRVVEALVQEGAER